MRRVLHRIRSVLASDGFGALLYAYVIVFMLDHGGNYRGFLAGAFSVLLFQRLLDDFGKRFLVRRINKHLDRKEGK